MDGETYHFCSAGCRAKFADDPAKYLTSHAPGAPPPTGSQDAIYTCPMHPQIRQKGPGNCPICGMALEPEGIAVSEGPNPELIDMTRRFWIGAALAVPLLILEMGAHLPGVEIHRWISPRASVWLQFLLATPVVLWAGRSEEHTSELQSLMRISYAVLCLK